VAEVAMDGALYLSRTLVDAEPITSQSGEQHTAGRVPTISVVNQTSSTPQPALCRSLIH
jgi:hypothetical protein